VRFTAANWRANLPNTTLLVDDGRGFAFAEAGEAKGYARKTTGSYYTPDTLVQAMLVQYARPVLDRVESEAEDAALGFLDAKAEALGLLGHTRFAGRFSRTSRLD
jgi:hypothetical protein